jgi:putative DNA primase/helicase
MAPPRDNDEARKLILAIGLEGTSIILIDNVSGSFGSEVLAAATTTDTWTGRLLGFSKTATVPLRAIWMITGNNVTFRGDLGRRVVACDIDPRCEHPEDRTQFQHPNLRDFVLAERPRLVANALTVLRAFHVAGRPSHGQAPKGSFEGWDSLIRGALIWVGAEDPLATRDRIREEADADLDALRQVMGEWLQTFPEPVTAAEAVDRANGAGKTELQAALAGLAGCPTAKLDSRKLGYALRRCRERRVAGRWFEVDGTNRTGVKRWRVATDQGVGRG